MATVVVTEVAAAVARPCRLRAYPRRQCTSQMDLTKTSAISIGIYDEGRGRALGRAGAL